MSELSTVVEESSLKMRLKENSTLPRKGVKLMFIIQAIFIDLMEGNKLP